MNPEPIIDEPVIDTLLNRPEPVIDGPATVITAKDTEGNWCHMPDRSKLDEGTYLIHAGGPGTTRWTMDRCGPHPTPTTTPHDSLPSATVTQPPADAPSLPETGSDEVLLVVGMTFVLIGAALRRIAR